MTETNGGKLEVGPEVVQRIKEALNDIMCLYHGSGRVVIDLRRGRITRVGLDVSTWVYTRGEKDDGC